MIYDMSQELRAFPYITNVYKCIAAYNLKGHQIGRKIGDMLELITMAGVYRCDDLKKRLIIECELEGETTAKHTVEFGFFADPTKREGLFGAVECKCIGVEETNKKTYTISKDNSFEINIRSQWMSAINRFKISVESCKDKTAKIKITEIKETPKTKKTPKSTTEKTHIFDMKPNTSIKIAIDEDENLLHTTPNGNISEELPGIIRECRSIKLTKIAKDTCCFSVYKCLAGPQTIEKAKQASLVAMDLRKRNDGQWEKIPADDPNRKMHFVHVISEFPHWESKSRAVVTRLIDQNIVVPDAVMVRAFEVFEETFGVNKMLDMIKKKKYSNNDADGKKIRKAIDKIFEEFEDHIFYDIATSSYVAFGYNDGKLITVQI